VTYQEIKENERKRAQALVDSIDQSDDKYIVYKHQRPITDIKQMFESSVELYGDNPAFHQRFVKGEPYQTVTYREALKDVHGLGTAMIQHGLHHKRIAVIGENCYQWASTYLAITGGVGVVVPLDKELKEDDLKALVKESEACAVFFTRKYEEIFRNIKASGETDLDFLVNLNAEENGDGIYSWKALISEGKALVEGGDRRYLDAEVIGDDMAALLFTSGTTGLTKGVMISQYNICFDLMSAPTILTVNTWDVFFSVLPIHHTYECTCGFLMPLYKGASIAYCEGLKYIQKNLQETRPTMFLGVPLIFESLYKAIMKNVRKQGKEKAVSTVLKLNKFTSKVGIDLNKKFLKDILNVFGGRMRVVISGGAAIDPDILQFFNDLGMIAVQGYGLTECAPMAALNPDNHKYMRNASVGHIMPGMQVKIADKGEDGIGEICIKGGNVMMGYYRMPEQTAESIVDGWFHTGDLGYTDDEDFIYITGRKKNVIITANGKNVFPEELEYLLGKVDLVAESMVWAEADEDGQDSTIVASIRPDTEALEAALGAEDAKDEEKVKALLWKYVDEINSKLPSFKCIKKISVRTEDFEKNTAHKIKRFVESNKR
jgi:long-subunit acyl-CoA synthetase (AMP-forming)